MESEKEVRGKNRNPAWQRRIYDWIPNGKLVLRVENAPGFPQHAMFRDRANEPLEQRLNGFGVSACAVCDGFFFRGKEVAIVGAGDTACEEAVYLSKLATTVHMIVRKGEDGMKASKVMQDRVIKTPNIKIYWDSETDEVLGGTKVESVRIKNNKTGEKQEIPVSAFFVAIGHEPNSAIFKGWLDMDDAGYLKTIPGTSKTNVEGVFASGDVQDKIYRQAVTAAGSGCMAALDAERYLSEKGLH
jgi:thioredoxin reductase (NADPH)